MERSIQEIMDSQDAMIQRLQKRERNRTRAAVAKFLQRQAYESKAVLMRHPRCDLMEVNYNDVLKDLEVVIKHMGEFFVPHELDLGAMQHVIDPGMHHSRKD